MVCDTPPREQQGHRQRQQKMETKTDKMHDDMAKLIALHNEHWLQHREQALKADLVEMEAKLELQNSKN